ncbi:iron-containing alcohol dehydrogenase [Oceanobacillus sp. CFH 90083]|uniref:iron-containing alcohol dehydrogenase n=1 Tax=Oceanobacillus sp. CFH 90083 TaxID=2592336 RepID=UPI00128D0A0C|nr:iron-containing alcohol dehydrogenase [Oceanobacillus sp. CFH 90083]
MYMTYQPKQITIGENSLGSLGGSAKKLKTTDLLVVIDQFLTTEPLNYDEKVNQILKQENIDVTFFSDYQGEPTTDHLEAALTIAKEQGVNGVAAIGGGSAIDIAKATALFYRNPQMEWDAITDQNSLERLPLIAIPTTAGTGSEATKVMVITDTEKGIKMNPGHPDLIPDIAILDPALTSSLPKNFTAYTGIDALTHAIEAFVSTKANIATDQYALTAIQIAGRSLPIVYNNGMNMAAREEMLLASTYAGIAFSNASTNLAHAAGRALGARFHIPHGLSVAVLLPLVMRFGLQAAPERYAQIAVALGEDATKDINELAEQSIQAIEKYCDDFQIWKDVLNYIDLQDLERNIDLLAKDALDGNGILTNRIVPSSSDIKKLFLDLVGKLSKVKGVNQV